MRSSRLFAIAVVAIVGTAGSVCADLHPAVVPDAGAAPGLVCPLAVDAPLRTGTDRAPCAGRIPAGASAFDEWLQGSVASSLSFVPPNRTDGSGSTAEVRELPPLPGSASLFLSAMLSVGGWHLLRFARHLHFGAVPEWYHTGGPIQIGHAVPFDLGLGALPVCCFQHPVSERPFLYRVEREQASCCDAQSFRIITAPRGPPAAT